MSEFTEVKTANLIGSALDWAVAQVEGITYNPNYLGVSDFRGPKPVYSSISNYSPSTDWSKGGPLIDKCITALNQSGTETWWAHCEDRLGLGPSALIAACRAIAAAKLGDTVSVPARLMP